MNFVKRFFFYLLLLGALLSGTWAYLKLKNSKKPREAAITQVPAGCMLYARTCDFPELNNRLNSRSLILDNFSGIKSCKRVLDLLDAFNYLASSSDDLLSVIRNNEIHFALYPENEDWLVLFNLKELGSENRFRDNLVSVLKAKEVENECYRFDLKTSTELYLKINEGLVCIASGSLILSQTGDPSVKKLSEQADFIEAQKSFEEQGLLSLFFDHDQLAHFHSKTKLKLNSLCKKGYSSVNADVQPSQISMNGFLKPDSKEVICALLNQKPQPVDFTDLLPYSTTYFKAFGYHDFIRLQSDVLPSNNKHINAFWNAATDTAMYDVRKDFYGNLFNSLVEFRILGFRMDSNHSFLFVSVNDSIKALEQLRYMSESSVESNGTRIYKLRTVQNKAVFLFDPIVKSGTGYAFLLNRSIYFSKGEDEAEELLLNLSSGSNLEQNQSFMDYAREQFPDEYNVLIYAASPGILQNLPSFFPALKNSSLRPFEDLKHSLLALSSRDKDFKLRWHLIQESKREEGGENMLWTLELDSVCNSSPVAFVNHTNGEREVLVQDESTALYLINSKGKIIWKKKIGEKILSNIFMVDMFRNNKFQILFNTANHIHLIDRNGNYVDTYPVKAPGRITSGINVFDYEGKKDFRVLFACDNKKIYNYTLYGIRQDGFTPFRTEAQVDLPVQYAKVGPSDYLFAIDRDGKIYSFSRKGETRMLFHNRAITNCKSFILDPSNNNPSSWIIYPDDKSNLLNKISFTDKKELVNLKPEGEIRASLFCLIDENRDPDLLLLSTGSLCAYNLNGNRIFESSNNHELESAGFYSDESHGFYFALSKLNQDLLILDPGQQSVKNLKASALPLVTDLFRNKKPCLVFPEKHRLNCMVY